MRQSKNNKCWEDDTNVAAANKAEEKKRKEKGKRKEKMPDRLGQARGRSAKPTPIKGMSRPERRISITNNGRTRNPENAILSEIDGLAVSQATGSRRSQQTPRPPSRAQSAKHFLRARD